MAVAQHGHGVAALWLTRVRQHPQDDWAIDERRRGIGGNAASVQSVQALPAFATALGLDSTYPFALECITLTTPGGNPGKADLTIQSPAGSTTAAKAFQSVTSSKTHPNPPLHKFVLYDQSRQHLYLSATDHADVFDLNAQAFLSAIEPPSAPKRYLWVLPGRAAPPALQWLLGPVEPACESSRVSARAAAGSQFAYGYTTAAGRCRWRRGLSRVRHFAGRPGGALERRHAQCLLAFDRQRHRDGSSHFRRWYDFRDACRERYGNSRSQSFALLYTCCA